MELPKSLGIPVNLLAACFNNTSATYKYYWLLSIIQSVETGQIRISKRVLFSKMISNAWFTINYFHVSFGKQDLIQNAIQAVKATERIPIDEQSQTVFEKLTKTNNNFTIKQLWHFNKTVPHWFLSSWFPQMKRIEIYAASQKLKNNCLYSLLDEEIVINSKWVTYLTDNARVLKDFCYWNLALFLQAKNPNVPDIPNKLIKPGARNSLVRQRIKFWDIVMNELGSVNCIYTSEELTIANYAVEHFIPYNFVSHDLIWNLIPASKSFNSKKSDKLPSLEKYFDPFYSLQKKAIEIIRKHDPRNIFLEDYLTIFSDLDELSNLPVDFTREKFKQRIQPLINIASNNGFVFLS